MTKYSKNSKQKDTNAAQNEYTISSRSWLLYDHNLRIIGQFIHLTIPMRYVYIFFNFIKISKFHIDVEPRCGK